MYRYAYACHRRATYSDAYNPTWALRWMPKVKIEHFICSVNRKDRKLKIYRKLVCPHAVDE